MKREIPKVVFTGGGSGGHLSIMKALLDYLSDEYGKDEVKEKIHVVGGRVGMIGDSGKSIDERIIPSFGVPYTLIRGGKFHRALRFTTIKLFFGVIPGFIDSFAVLKKHSPDIVFATGGYVTLPMIIIAKLLGIRVVIHEQTHTAGLTNKIGARFADKVLTTFPESKRYFPEKKVKLTGNIIRAEVFAKKTKNQELTSFVKFAKNQNKSIMYVTGGSLGAHKINEFILRNIDAIVENFRVIWQIGGNKYHNDYQKILDLIKTNNLHKNIFVAEYFTEELGYILDSSNVVVCRPGINTLYELAALNKSAVMIPLWVTSASDQETNALWFKSNFNGEILKEGEFSYKEFQSAVEKVMKKQVANPATFKVGSSLEVWEEIVSI